jgi:hypothetical protein
LSQKRRAKGLRRKMWSAVSRGARHTGQMASGADRIPLRRRAALDWTRHFDRSQAKNLTLEGALFCQTKLK